MTYQPPLFPLEDDDEKLTGKVWFDGTHWIATIADWWFATGKTEAEAIRKATENYEKENERTQ